MKALLVMDIQTGYLGKYDETLVERINQRIEEAFEQKEIIIYVKNAKKLRGGVKIDDLEKDLFIRSSYILTKGTASVFSNEKLEQILKKNQVTELEVIGIDGNSCVASSALDASRRGYQVTMPCEYIGVKNSERFEARKALLAEQGIVLK